MWDLTELYRDVILDHNRNPRNFGKPEGTTVSLVGNNPLCGDRLMIHLVMEGDTIRALGFEGQGCAISTASASVMTESLEGKTRADAEKAFRKFHDFLTTDSDEEADIETMGEIAALGGVRRFPIRVKCATLAWHTMRAALGGNTQYVTTE